MAKTYKILVNDGKGTDIKPTLVNEGAGNRGEPAKLVAKRGWRFQLVDEAKGKDIAPDQVRVKRDGKNLLVMFDGSQRADVVIEDYYADNTDTDKDNGMPSLVGAAENGGLYEYVPQDPAISSLPSELKDNNTPVIVSLGGGPLGDEFVLSGLPLVAATGINGWLLAGGAAVVAAGGGGKGGGGDAVVVAKPSGQTGFLKHDLVNDTGTSQTDSLTNNQNPVYTGVAEKGAKVVVTVNGVSYETTASSTDGTYSVTLTNNGKVLPDGPYTPTITVSNSAGDTTVDGSAFTVDHSTFIEPSPVDPFNPPVNGKSGLRVTIDTDTNNDGFISNAELPTSGKVAATISLTKDAAVGDVLTVITQMATGSTTRTLTLTQADITAGKVVLTDLVAPAQADTLKVTASIKDAAGNASPTPDASDSATLNSAKLGVTILNDTNNDGYINKAESDAQQKISVKVDVPTGAVAGTVITVSDGVHSVNHALTADEVTAKSFTLTNAFDKPAEGATITVTAQIGTDTANAGSDSAKLDTSRFIDPVDPVNPVDPTKSGLRVTIDTDANNDAVISNAELPSSKLVTATVALTKDAAVGDVLTVSATGNTTRTITLTQADITAGKVVLTDLAAPADGSSIMVSASIKDAAGNTSLTPDASDTAKLNTEQLSVVITTDANNDGFINKAELGEATKVSVRVDIPATAKAGEKITLTSGSATVEHTLTADDVAAKGFTLSSTDANAFAAPAHGGTITVTATYTNANVSLTSTDTAKVDVTPPVPGDTQVSLNAITGDDYLSKSEQTGMVTLTGQVTGTFRAGDEVRVVVKDTTYTTHVDASGKFAVTQVPAADLVNDTDKKVQATVVASDEAGNTTQANTERAYTVEDGNQGLKTAIALNAVADDNVVSATEAGAATTTISGKVSGTFKVGDMVTLSVNNKTYQASVNDDGAFSTDVNTADVLQDADLRIEARVTGTGGDTATASQSYVVDSGPTPSKTALTINPVTDDNILNLAESNGTVNITGKVTGKFAAGDVVILEANDKRYTGAVLADGSYSIAVPGADLKADPDSTVVGIVTGTGGTTASAVQNYGIDVTPPNNADVKLAVSITTDTDNSGVVNTAELNGSQTFTSTATFDKTKVAVGDKIVFTASNGTTVLASVTHTLTAADLTTGSVTVTFAKPEDGQVQTVTANYVDKAGNEATDTKPTDNAKLDTSAPNGGTAPIVKIATDGNDDNWLNNTEIEAGNATFKSNAKVSITASFDKTKVSVGDTVVFKVGTLTREVVLTDAQVQAEVVSIQVDAPAKGQSISATALIKDSNGNSTPESAADTATRNSLDAVADQNKVTASGSANTVKITGNVIAGDGSGVGKDLDPQYFGSDSYGTNVFVAEVKRAAATAFQALSANGGSVEGEFGTLTIKADGTYDYVLSGNANVRALLNGEIKTEVFTYKVKDAGGNESETTLSIEVKGVNDAATISILGGASTFVVAAINTGLAETVPNALTIKDDDAGQAMYDGISPTAASVFNLKFGTLTLTPTSTTSTSTGYKFKYDKNTLGLEGSSDTIRHDLFTLQSSDGTATQTLDFELAPSGTATKQEFHTSSTAGLKINSAKSTTTDTLVLDGAQMSFDFSAPTPVGSATPNITSIEKVDIKGSGDNTIRLSLDSLMQADAVGGVHKLFIDGDSGDVVNIANANITADTTTVSGYHRYVFDATHELLIQNAITTNFVS